MAQVFLGLGSNVGDRASTIAKAIQELSALPDATFIRSSSLYETEPWGNHDQPAFLNAVVEIATQMQPHELLSNTLAIEARLGRVREERWGPRTMDIDILLYDDLVMDDSILTIPHPRMRERRFVLVPLLEIAPMCVDPRSGMKWVETEKACSDTCHVTRVSDLGGCEQPNPIHESSS
jgi:2-amino-4-hydroxy-6-hydroxymethyldihydropteridine diphosphokinase